jgi:hypothetical protein
MQSSSRAVVAAALWVRGRVMNQGPVRISVSGLLLRAARYKQSSYEHV